MESERIRFGPAGNSDSFYKQGHKHSGEMPAWLQAMGLDAYEYSFGRGVNLGEAKAGEIGNEAAAHGIAVSVHAPYYINLANEDESAREKSREYLFRSATLARVMGARRIVFHSGARMGKDRADALRRTLGEVEKVLAGLGERGLSGMLLCPETMGKANQQGTLDEVLEICSVDREALLPAVDFGHIHALEQGSLKTKDDFEAIIDRISQKLGEAAAARMHIHFSHIEYGRSGEVRHLTMEDDVFGPDFEPLARVLCERKLHPVVICESRDVMAEDALSMKRIYEACCGKTCACAILKRPEGQGE